jgi:hypothetical protein
MFNNNYSKIGKYMKMIGLKTKKLEELHNPKEIVKW